MEIMENIVEKFINRIFQEYATIKCNILYIIIVNLGVFNNAIKYC